jgi:peptidoglycan/xylan/chitin deacetylase (PgdA/CDA1 family)
VTPGELLERAPASRWRPSPVAAASMGLHAAAVAVLLTHPELWAWPLAAVAANHGVLTVLALLPRNGLLGPNLRRLPPESVRRGEIALTFDDGPDPKVTPLVLEMLEAQGARGTFFCIAEEAARYPELCREIVRRGHGVENHSRAHLYTFALRGMAGMRREIMAGQAILAELCGAAPRFFRPPAGVRSPLLDPVLHGLGLRLVSWTRRGYDTRHRDAGEVASRLIDGLAAGDILLMHDGNCARTDEGRPIVLEVLPRLLEAARARNLRPVALHQALAA